ncbi:IMS domain-containing protein [Synechococcus sp. W4D4]|uniref:IMS domain-containing protein n=1 Tax=Synechococcus sp. W4D4 TaxID=3392294 RepID=UPI0039EA4987
MELPIDHFRLLGVNASSDRQSVLRTLQQRLDRIPDQGFTQDTLQARAELLEASADLLSDETRRQAYERELTAIADNANGSIAALEIPPSREVGGLLLLMEAGQSQEAFDSASRGLQPPQAPALGSSREADLTLLAGLACQGTARDYRDQRRYEAAALTLQQGLQLLQRMGQQAEQRRKLEQDLKELLPYRVLDLISRDLSASTSRLQGIALLEQLVQQRGGLEGHTDLTFPQSEFQPFFKQIRQFLTAQEQVELFSRWGDSGSATADFLASFALTASGFSQRKPERILEAYERLKNSGQPGIEVFLSCQQLLLGQVDEAERLFELGADAALKQWAMEQGDDPLARLCAYCRDWLTREVLEGFRDIDIDANLDAWFADRDVQAYIDQQDRIRGRQFNAKPSFEVPAATETSTAFGDWPSFDLSSSSETPTNLETLDEEEEGDDELWDGPRWRLPALPELQWPQLGSLNERLQELPSWGRPVGVAVVVMALGFGGWVALKPRGAEVETATSGSNAALVQPESTAPAAPAQANPFPLSDPDPSASQLQGLLEAWLSEKAAVLAGDAPSETLADLARPDQIQRLQRQAQANRQRGATETVNTTITGFKISERSGVRIAAQVALTYSDELRTKAGKVLSRTPEMTLRNTYVFGRKNGSWQLVAYKPTAKN